MTPEMIAIITVGIALAGLVLTNSYQHNARIQESSDQHNASIRELREGLAEQAKQHNASIRELQTQIVGIARDQARLEGLLHGLFREGWCHHPTPAKTEA